MSKFGKLLRTMREEAGKSVPEVSDYLTSLGFKAATQTVYGWERGLSQPNPDLFLSMCKFYGVTDVLSYFGYRPIKKEKTPQLSDEAMTLAADYDHRMDVWGRKAVRELADIEIERALYDRRRAAEEEYDTPDNVIHVAFRCSVQPASAGTGIPLGPDSFEIIYIPDSPLIHKASFGVPVSGDSMEPRYHNGDILIVESAEEIEAGEVGLFTIDGEGFVKILGKEELISLNPEYSPIPMNESIRCHGRVIGVIDSYGVVEE